MTPNTLLYPFMLTNGMAYLTLPDVITQNDADRLCKMIQTLVIEEKGSDESSH